MGRQNGQSTVSDRKLVLFHRDQGRTLREIGNIVNRSYSTVYSIIKRHEAGQGVENKTRESPRKIFNLHDERWLLRKVKENPKISAPKLAIEAEKYLKKKADPETIRIILRKNDLKGRFARKKPFVSKTNLAKRLSFVREHINKDFDFWRHVIFSDESKYNLFGSDGRVNVRIGWEESER